MAPRVQTGPHRVPVVEDNAKQVVRMMIEKIGGWGELAANGREFPDTAARDRRCFAGMDDSLAKPVTIEPPAQVLKRYLTGTEVPV